MLNRALRTMEVDLIVKTGFFVRDLHKQIVELHAKQFDGQSNSNTLIVYRGQGLSQTDFDQLKKTQDGLLSFNNFLSTSENRDVSLRFAQRTVSTSDLVGVLFVMKIDLSLQVTPFANAKNVSCYEKEEEILFSMHSVFRIGQLKQLDESSRLWQVELTLTSDNDPQLHALTKRMQEETKGPTGWHSLDRLMPELGEFNKAEKLYDLLLQKPNTEHEKAYLFHQLGSIKTAQGKYNEAVEFLEKAIEINEKSLFPTDLDLAASYNNIGLVCYYMGEYSKALLYFEKALGINQKILPATHPSLATSYNNIGLMYDKVGEYSKALPYFERALEIMKRSRPLDHSHIKSVEKSIEMVKKNL